MVGDVFVALGIDKGECLKIEMGDSSVASFMASVDECICERDHTLYEEGLTCSSRMVKLSLYKNS